MAGKVSVFYDEADPVDSSGGADSLGDTKETVLIKEYDSKDAAILKLFFKEELNEIEGVRLVNCEPPQGQGVKLLIKCKRNKKERIDQLMKDLDDKLKSIEEREVTVPKDTFAKLAEHMRSEEKRLKDAQQEERVLYRPDIVKKIVNIYFWPGNEKAVIKLKQELGIEIGGTRNRSALSDQAEGVNPSGAGSLQVSDFKITVLNDKDSTRSFGRSLSLDQPRSTGDHDHEYEYMECGPSPQPSAITRSDLVVKDFPSGLKLLVYKDSILNLPVNAIVNAANSDMMHGGGVAKVIAEAAGWTMDRESKDKVNSFHGGMLPASKNIVTTAGKLRYQGIIHAVGPQWYDGRYKDDKVRCLDDLCDTIKNVLNTCDREGYKTVALPAISAGIYGVPKELCADMYVKAAAEYSMEPGRKDPKELHIVDIDVEILDLVKKSIHNFDKDPKLLDQRSTVPKYLASRPQSSWRGRNRGQHHGQGSNRGHGSGQNHGSSHGQGHDSTWVEQLKFEDLGISCEVKKLQEEPFKWGAIAQLFSLNSNLKVKIFKGDITKSSNDALVCGIGTDMQFSGLVADALKTAGGFYFENAVSKTIRSTKTGKPGEVMKCVSGKLKVKWVIFVVCDRLKDVDAKQNDMYRECVFNLVKKANEWNIPKIAIPLFSTGNLQTNENKLQKCGIALLQALDNFVDYRAGKHVNVKEIHLVNNSDLVTSTLVKVFDAASKKYGHNSLKTASEKGSGRQTEGQEVFEHGKVETEHRGSASGDNTTYRSNKDTGARSTSDANNTSPKDNSTFGKDKYRKNMNFPSAKRNETPRNENASGVATYTMKTSGKDSGDESGSTNESKNANSVSTMPPNDSNSAQTAAKQTGNLVIIDD